MRGTCVLFGIVLALAGAPGVASAAEPAAAPASALVPAPALAPAVAPAPALASAVVPAPALASALVSAPALSPTPVPALAHAPLPASLLALEQKMEELQVTSMRFSAETSFAVSRGSHRLKKLLKLLLSTGISGEETFSPAAGNVTFTLFGHPFKLRLVGNTTYLYFRALARHDHGRPWIKLGPGGLFELFKVNGKHVKPPTTPESKVDQPALAEPPFTGLRKALAGAEEVRETGNSTLYGQPVTSFLAILEPEQLEHEKGLASTSRRLPSPQPPMVTLETSLAQNGLPVRTVIAEHGGGLTVSATVNIPAINFPLVVEAPPASQTISIARLRKIERRDRRRRRSKTQAATRRAVMSGVSV